MPLSNADNSYGRCVDCGVDIDPRRLLAQPAAARCIRCQAEAERQLPPPVRG